VTYQSPFSSRSVRRQQRAALLPKLLGALIVLTLLVAGAIAWRMAGFTITRLPGAATPGRAVAPGSASP